MRKKLRIYLDTSVISYLDQQDAPEKMKETQKAWGILQSNEYEVVISDVALAEIEECDDKKYQNLIEYLSELEYITYLATNETKELADIVKF